MAIDQFPEMLLFMEQSEKCVVKGKKRENGILHDAALCSSGGGFARGSAGFRGVFKRIFQKILFDIP